MSTNGQQTLPIRTQSVATQSNKKSFTAEEIEQWTVTYLADMLEISADEIETNVPFDTYGLDSSAAVGLTGDLEDWLGQEIDPTILYDYPTIETLATYLSNAQQETSYDNN